MADSDIISKVIFELPIYSFNVVDDEVVFRQPNHVPSSMDTSVPMTYRQWRDLGSPLKIEVTIYPCADDHD